MPCNDERDLSTFLLAGAGGVGRAVLAAGREFLASFNNVVVIDNNERQLENLPLPAERIVLDIADSALLSKLLARFAPSFFLVNLTERQDNFQVRRTVASLGGAYLDTASSMIANGPSDRYSRIMPHTFSPVGNKRHHLVCCGINPGLVELVARGIIRRHFREAAGVDIHYMESDTLNCRTPPGSVAVSWCPSVLIDEVLFTPSIEMAGGRLLERESAPAPLARLYWKDAWLRSRIVGHEEIWNAQFLSPKVRNCCFAYSLPPKVMALFDGNPDEAGKKTFVPNGNGRLRGSDTIVVKVSDTSSEKAVALQWHTSHTVAHDAYGVNATQLQTGLSVLCFCELLAGATDAVPERPLCGSTIPDSWFENGRLQELWDRYGIAWKSAAGRYFLENRSV